MFLPRHQGPHANETVSHSARSGNVNSAAIHHDVLRIPAKDDNETVRIAYPRTYRSAGRGRTLVA